MKIVIDANIVCEAYLEESIKNNELGFLKLNKANTFKISTGTRYSLDIVDFSGNLDEKINKFKGEIALASHTSFEDCPFKVFN